MATILTGSTDAPGQRERIREQTSWALVWIAPALALLAWRCAPLVTGERTLFLRDTLKTHLALRAYFAEAFRRFELPLLDPLRAGGQGLLGNPNVVALYPDNVLLFWSSTLWQLNAHFWIHWLVAFGAALWLARAWGLGREGAAGAATVYAFSGHFLSQMNLYNGVAPVALAPALAAALLELRHPERRRWALPALGALWALELVGGDPILAILALVAALVLGLPHRRSIPWLRAGVALAGGTLLAAPQWVETLRLLPASFRGFWVSGQGEASKASPSPEALLDLIMPLFFGRPDRTSYWGSAAFGGLPPLYWSLAPGLLAVALACVGLGAPEPRERMARRVLLGLLATGVLVTFSSGTITRIATALPGGGLFRFSAKVFLFSALAFSVLAGVGLERILDSADARQKARRAILVLATMVAALFALFSWPDSPVEEVFRRIFAPGLSDQVALPLRVEWRGIALAELALLVTALLVSRAWERRPRLVSAWLPLHAASQLVLLSSMLPTDDAAFYRQRPPLLAGLPAGAVLFHGAHLGVFGAGPLVAEGDLVANERAAHLELYGYSGLLAGRRFEFDASPEGLDSFLVQSATLGAKFLKDADRVHLLAATGVDRLLLTRPLDAAALEVASLELVPTTDAPCFVYRIEGALEEAQLLGEVRYAPHVGAAFDAVRRGIDPRVEAVVAGEGSPVSRPRGRAELKSSRAEEVLVDVDSSEGGVLVVRRSWLPIWRASLDGREADAIVANVTRLALEMPPGSHEVRFWIDRSPLRVALALAALGAALLALLGLRARSESPRVDSVPADAAA